MFRHDGRQYFLQDGPGVVVYDLDTKLPVAADQREQRAARKALREGEKAMTYVWGRQDAGDDSQAGTDVSIDFGNAYAVHVFRFESQQHFCQTNIKHAFESWCATGTIDV